MIMKLKVMTFNLRFRNEADGINIFDNRLPRVIEAIKPPAPDLVGFQEATDVRRAALRQSLDGYVLIGCGRKQNYRGEGLCIAYRKDAFELIDYTTFWLSDTPNAPGSRYENSDQSTCPRITMAAKFSPDGYDGCITFINTHLDHKGAAARLKGMKQIAGYMESVEGIYVLTGDMNAKPDELAAQMPTSLKAETLTEATADIPHTFHNYGQITEGYKIDYIYTNAEVCESYARDDGPVDGIWISDHYPVVAILEI